ncbi:MAG: phage tail tape measure protein [Methylobacter tundripaludum]|nr:phage tail tape measure protein [Methylobacter tundripaludum]
MSNRDMKLSLLLSLKDNMSNGLVRALKSVTDNGKQAESSLKKAADAAMRAKPTALEQVGRAAKNVDQSGKQAATSLDKLVAAANKPRTSAIDKLATSLKNVRSVAAATLDTLNSIARAGAQAAAGGYVLSAAAKRPVNYETQVAALSNTASSGLNAAGRIASQKTLDAAIQKAIRENGGAQESAIDNLNALVGSGAFGNGKDAVNNALAMLPTVQKAQTASLADGKDIAQILISAKQTMGIADAQMPALISKAIKAGQEGGFELKDMAKWLPQQMTLAAANGMKGMSGFESILAANQAGRIVAGTSDEAGNNLVNLLAKINSSDTINDYKKMGIDLSGSLATARGKGGNPLEAFVALTERIANKDKDYAKLRAKADKAAPGEQKATYEAMADILMQKGLGKSVQDRQALMQLLAMIQQKPKYEEVKGVVKGEAGAELNTSSDVMRSTTGAKLENISNDVAKAANDSLASIKGPLDTLLDKSHELASAHGELAAAAYGAATVLGAIGAVGVTGSVLGGGKALAAGGAAGFGGKLLELAKNVVSGPAKAPAGPVSWANLSKATMLPAATQGGGLLSLLKGAGAGAALFSALDYVSPPSALNKPGQSPMEFAGSLLFSKLGLDLADVINTVKGGDEMNITALREFVNRLDVISQRPVQVSVALDGQQIAASVNTSNAQQSRRN